MVRLVLPFQVVVAMLVASFAGNATDAKRSGGKRSPFGTRATCFCGPTMPMLKVMHGSFLRRRGQAALQGL